MEEEPDPDQSNPPGPESSTPPVGTGLAGETTGAFPSSMDQTVLASTPQFERIGDFEVLGKLGQGGMGAVYRARQVSLDRQVALKILPATLETDAEFVTRFQREARIAASLSHPNLVKVYSSGMADGSHFIAMELVEGETLGQLVRRGPLSPPDALRICLDVARALQCGWDKAHLIHRDIKPGNIFLSENGEVKVGDLGLAKSMAGDTTGLTNTGTAMGTPHYISPEQARGEKDLDFRADIYSLGCTLFQMLTGKTPYQGRDPVSVMHQHIHGPPPAILKSMPQCPIPLARLVGKMLKKVKRERQASYVELIADIERVQTLFAPAVSALESRLEAEETLLEASAPTAPAQRPSVSICKPKSKKVLYVAMGIGAAALVIITISAFPKKGSLKKGQQGEVEQLTATGTASTSHPSAPVVAQKASAEAAEPLTIKLWDAPEKIPAPQAGAQSPEWKNGALYLGKNTAIDFKLPSNNAVVRAKIRMNPTAVAQQVNLWSGGEILYRLSLWSTGGMANAPDSQRSIMLSVDRSGKDQTLGKWPWPRSFGPDEWVTLELRAIDGWLTATFDGATLGKVQAPAKETFTGVRIGAMADGYFRNIEYVLLDGADRSWKPVLIDPTQAKGYLGGRYTFEEGLLTLEEYALLDSQPASDAAIRARIQVKEDMCWPGLIVRGQPPRYYSVAIGPDRKTLNLAYFSPQGNRTLSRMELSEPLAVGSVAVLEFRAVGAELTGWLNGKQVLAATENTLSDPGRWGIITDGLATFERIDGQLLMGGLGSPAAGELTATGAGSTNHPSTAVVPQKALSEAVEPLAIKLWDSPEKIPAPKDGAQTPEWKDGVIHLDKNAFLIFIRPSQNAVARAKIRMNPNSVGPQVSLWSDGKIYRLSLWVEDWNANKRDRKRNITIGCLEDGKNRTLEQCPLPRPFGPDEWITLELRAIDGWLTASLDGAVLGKIQMPTKEKFRGMRVDAIAEGYFRDIVYVPLDGVNAVSNHASNTGWKPLFEGISPPTTGGSIQVNGDKIRIEKTGWIIPQPSADAAIRARIVYSRSNRSPALRLHSDGKDSYKLAIGEGEVMLSRFLLGNFSVLKRAPLPEINDGESIELEFRCVGQELTGFVNGKQVISVRDDALVARAGWGISGDWVASFASVEGKSITNEAILVPE